MNQLDSISIQPLEPHVAKRVECPNCGEMVPGLYSGDARITHCGCYYDDGDVNLGNDPFWTVWGYSADGMRLCLL